MKIGLVSPYTLNHGGVQEHIRHLYQNLSQKGHDVKIIAPRQGREKPKKDVIFIGRGVYVKGTSTGAYITVGLHYGPEVEEVLSHEKFDIIHFHEPINPTFSWFVLAYSQSINIITAHRTGRLSAEGFTLYQFLQPLRLLLSRKIHGWLAVSEAAAKTGRHYLPGPYHIIPNGVDIKRFSPRGTKVKKFADGVVNILFVGRIEERKGLIYLIKAFAQLSTKQTRLKESCRLIIVGDGPLKKDCQKFVEKKKIKEVFFEGEVPPEILPRYYRTADIFCSPAIRGESFGMVLLEAMASGLPVVASGNAGYKELLAGYPNRKLLTPPADIDDLTQALETLVKDKKSRKELGQWGLLKAKKYSWSKISRQILDFYCQTAEKKKNDQRAVLKISQKYFSFSLFPS